MLPRKNRYSFKDKLPKQILNFPSFTIRYGENEEGLKAAVVVSKKVDKRAVVRNKIKRVILETVRKNLEMDTSLTLVFYVKKQAVDSLDLEREVVEAVNQLTK